MSEPKRKYEAEAVLIPALKLQPVSPLSEKPTSNPPLRIRRKDFIFNPDIIWRLTQRIKEL
ncbi:MAG: hypothetical protein ABIG63_01845 [Chloroflexota bacterium]